MPIRFYCHLSIALIFLSLLAFPLFGAPKSPRKDRSKKWVEVSGSQRSDCPATHLTGLCTDTHRALWVTDEGKGLFRRAYNRINWERYHKDGKGMYRLPTQDNELHHVVEDFQGRLWVGTLRDGVLVFNGQEWRKYTIEEGIPGERILTLKVQPKGGDVWIGTSGGLVRYSQATNKWRIWNRLEGLPSDQVYAICFDLKNNLYLGTDCEGILIASPKDDYSTFRRIRYQRGKSRWSIPLTHKGKGIPSDQINALFCSRKGIVYAGTSGGLAWTKDQGKSWQFVRGRDWEAKGKGLYTGKYPKPRLLPAPQADYYYLPTEDYITCINEDTEGHLWVGMREKGTSEFDPQTMRLIGRTDLDYPIEFSPWTHRVYTATYGSGLQIAQLWKESDTFPDLPEKPHPAASFPEPLPLPTRAEVDSLCEKTEKMLAKQKKNARPWVIPLRQDWTTQGDWVAHYGRRLFVGCGMEGQFGDFWNMYEGLDGTIRTYVLQLGPQSDRKDGLRHWIHDFVSTSPKSLWNLFHGIRMQAECDDHGENYSRAQEGPGIFCYIAHLGKSPGRVSFYFYNKDGHQGPNRHRDYLIRVRTTHVIRQNNMIGTGYDEKAVFSSAEEAERCRSRQSTADLESLWFDPVIAQTRVKDFYGGVWVSFMIGTPGRYSFEISRNYSFNTTLMAVAIDDGDADHSHQRTGDWSQSLYGYPGRPAPGGDLKLWNLSAKCLEYSETVLLRNSFKQLSYRAAMAFQRPDKDLDFWIWYHYRWNAFHRKWFRDTMKDIWALSQWRGMGRFNRQMHPHSPNTMFDTLAEERAFWTRYAIPVTLDRSRYPCRPESRENVIARMKEAFAGYSIPLRY